MNLYPMILIKNFPNVTWCENFALIFNKTLSCLLCLDNFHFFLFFLFIPCLKLEPRKIIWLDLRKELHIATSWKTSSQSSMCNHKETWSAGIQNTLIPKFISKKKGWKTCLTNRLTDICCQKETNKFCNALFISEMKSYRF